jgi:hypothetical protein
VATLPEQLARVPKRPCDDRQTQDAVGSIVNVLNQYFNSVTGSIQAECTLNNSTLDCGPLRLDVENFKPRWDTATMGPFPLPTPTDADNWLSKAIKPGATLRAGLLGYSYEEGRWRVDEIGPVVRTMVTDIQQTSNKSFTWDTVTVTVNTCEDDLPHEFLIETVVARVLQSIAGGGCNITGAQRDVEVFSDVDAGSSLMVTFDVAVDVLIDVYLTSGGIYGHYITVYVPCTANEYLRLLIATETCTSGSG